MHFEEFQFWRLFICYGRTQEQFVVGFGPEGVAKGGQEEVVGSNSAFAVGPSHHEAKEFDISIWEITPFVSWNWSTRNVVTV